MLSRRSYSVIERNLDGLKVHTMVNNLDHEEFGETFANPRA